MKLFQKILVVILSVTMIFSTFPFAVFAADSGSGTDPRTIEVVQHAKGTGADGSITITLSMDVLTDLLSSAGDSGELQEKLLALVDQRDPDGNSVESLITLSDIMEIVPFSSVLAVLIGEDHKGLGLLIENLGGVEVIRDMIDVERVAGAIEAENLADFFVYIKEAIENGDLTGIETAIKTDAVFSLNIPINTSKLVEYIDFSKIKEKFAALSFDEKRAIFSDFDGFVTALVNKLKDGTLKKNDGTTPLTLGDLVIFTSTDPATISNINKIVKELIELDTALLADVLTDVSNAGYAIPDTAYDVNISKVEAILSDPANAAFKNSLINRILNPDDPNKQIITDTGITALTGLLSGQLTVTADDVAFILGNEDYITVSALIAAAKNPATTFLTTAGIKAIIEAAGITVSASDLAAIFDGHTDRYDFNTLKGAITEAGRLAVYNELYKDTASVADLINAFTVSSAYYDATLLKSAITDDGLAAVYDAIKDDNIISLSDAVTTFTNYTGSDDLLDAAAARAAFTPYGQMLIDKATPTYGDDAATFAVLQQAMGGTAGLCVADYESIIKNAITLDGKKLLMDNVDITSAIINKVANVLLSNDAYYNLSALKLAVKEEGKLYLTQNLNASQVISVLSKDASYYNLDTVISAITAAGWSALFETYDTTNFTAGTISTLLNDPKASTYYNETTLRSLLNANITTGGKMALAKHLFANNRLDVSVQTLKDFMGTQANYNLTNLADAVFRTLDDDGVTVKLADIADVDVAELMKDAEISAFLRGKLNDYITRLSLTTVVDTVNKYGGMAQFLNTNIYSYNSLIDLALTQASGQYLYVDVSSLVDKLLGANPMANLQSVLKPGYTVDMILTDSEVVNMATVMELISQTGGALDTYVDFNKIFELLKASENGAYIMGDLLNQVDPGVLGDELGDNMDQIMKALTDEQYTNLLTLVLSRALVQIETVAIDGYYVGERLPGKTQLEFSFDAIVAALWEILPKFEEIGADEFDGTLTAFNFKMDYETYGGEDDFGLPLPGVHKDKDINITVKIDGDLDNIRRAAKALDRYIQIEKINNFFTVNINVPEVVTDIYRYMLESGNGDAFVSLRQKFLSMETMTGKEIAEMLSAIPFAEIIAGLRDVEINELYERLVSTGKVNALAQKIEAYTNLKIDLDHFATLDQLLSSFRSDNLSTIADMIHQISEKTGTDLEGMLKKVAQTIDTNEYAQKLWAKASTVPGVSKFFKDITAQEILEEYQGYNPIRAMVQYATDRLERDLVSKFYSEKTAEELYQAGVSFANARLSGIYKRFCQVLARVADSNYTPTDERLAKVWQYIPEGLVTKLRGISLLDYYRGNGVFPLRKII